MVSILFGTIQCLAVHAEQRRARLDLVGWATSDGVAHILSCGYRGPYPHSYQLCGHTGLHYDVINVHLQVTTDMLSEAFLHTPLESSPSVAEAQGHGCVVERIKKGDGR